MAGVPQVIPTPRLSLRRPNKQDAHAIFESYGSDPEVSRFLTWRTHRSLQDTNAFLHASDRGWIQGTELPFLAWSGETLVGSTGLTLLAEQRARTGYLVARDRWGNGFASEMLVAMIQLARLLDVSEVEALVQPGHERSVRVLSKAGFSRAGVAMGVHPNLSPNPQPVERYLLRL